MLRVKTIFTYSTGAPWVSIMHFGGAIQSDATNANAAVGAFWGTVDNLINSSVTWTTDAVVQNIEETTGALVGLFPVTPVTGVGAVATEILPVVNQALVSWRTGVFRAGRELRGRTFIPGLTEAAATLGFLASGTQVAIQAAADALIADALSTLRVWHRPAPSGVDGQDEIVTTSATWNKFAVLRSRRD